MTYEKKQYLNALLITKAQKEIDRLEGIISKLVEERKETFLKMTEEVPAEVESLFKKVNERYKLHLDVSRYTKQIKADLEDGAYCSHINTQEKYNTDIERLHKRITEISETFFPVKGSEFSLKALELFAENEEACKLSTLRKIAKDTNI